MVDYWSFPGIWMLELGAFLSLLHRCPIPNPAQIYVGWRSIVMRVVCGRISSDRPLIAPTMIFDVAIGERHHAAAVMRAIGKIEKTVPAHVNPKIRPANTVGIDIHERDVPAGHRLGQFRMFEEDFVSG